MRHLDQLHIHRNLHRQLMSRCSARYTLSSPVIRRSGYMKRVRSSRGFLFVRVHQPGPRVPIVMTGFGRLNRHLGDVAGEVSLLRIRMIRHITPRSFPRLRDWWNNQRRKCSPMDVHPSRGRRIGRGPTSPSWIDLGLRRARHRNRRLSHFSLHLARLRHSVTGTAAAPQVK
jgi:hypothetical protein